MRIKIEEGVEMVELNEAELASLDARIHSLDNGECRTFTDAELDERWRVEDAKDERDDRE